MRFNQITFNLALAALIVFALYTLTYSGLSGLLLCTAISLIAAAFFNQFEIVVAVSIIFGLFYIYFLRKFLRKLEPFTAQDNAQKIVSRVEEIKKEYKQVPQGVYNPAIEGFADVNSESKSTEIKNGQSATSTPASSQRTEEVKLTKDVVDNVTTALSDSKDNNEKKEEENKSKELIQKEEFSSAAGALFKLGQMPSENKEGPYVDSGSTLLKAMESLNPEQISSMTLDTKKLIDTQKNLMNVLGQMQPVLSDGKKLLDTFSNMFGGSFKL